MANVVARLGNIEFSIPAGTLQEIARRTSWRVDVPTPMEGLGKPTVRGRDSDTLTINGLVFPGATGDAVSVQRFRDAADAGKSLLLVDGNGDFHGAWFIASVDENKDLFFGSGATRRATWTMSLVADPEEGLL
jgi:phage protein U